MVAWQGRWPQNPSPAPPFRCRPFPPLSLTHLQHVTASPTCTHTLLSSLMLNPPPSLSCPSFCAPPPPLSFLLLPPVPPPAPPNASLYVG